ncbi:MAG: YciI family protein [Nitrospiraceae bacterium]|nr:YciI family protein [Nitrospiraceae bacterium]
MFIISLEYKKPLTEVDLHLPAHIEYLKAQYEAGNFLLSGRKNPRTVGIILSNAGSKEDLDKIIKEDPFIKHDVADYEILEFEPSMACAELDFLKNK